MSSLYRWELLGWQVNLEETRFKKKVFAIFFRCQSIIKFCLNVDTSKFLVNNVKIIKAKVTNQK